jgi:hypothetical protein
MCQQFPQLPIYSEHSGHTHYPVGARTRQVIEGSPRQCSLNHAQCSLNHAQCSLNHEKCSLNHAKCSLGPRMHRSSLLLFPPIPFNARPSYSSFSLNRVLCVFDFRVPTELEHSLGSFTLELLSSRARCVTHFFTPCQRVALHICYISPAHCVPHVSNPVGPHSTLEYSLN